MPFKFNPITATLDLVGSQTSGTPNTVAGYDGSGNLYSIPDWNVSTDTGGANILLNLTPTDPGTPQTFSIHNFQNTITPTNDLTNLNYLGLQNYTYLNGPEDFLNFTGMSNGIETPGLGYKGNIVTHRDTLSVGDGTNVSTSDYIYLLDGYINVSNNHTNTQIVQVLNHSASINAGAIVNSLNGQNLYIQVDGTVNSNIQLQGLGTNINVDQPASTGVIGSNMNSNIDGLVQFVNGYGVGINFNSNGEVTNSVQPFADTVNYQSGSIAGGHTGFGTYTNLQSGSTMDGTYIGVQVSPSFSGTITSGNGINLLSANPQVATSVDYINGIGVFATLNSGTSVTNGYSSFSENTNFQSGSTLNYYTGYGLFPNFHSGSAITSFQGLNFAPTLDTNIGSFTLANFSGIGSGTITNLAGIELNLSQYITSNQPIGVRVQDGNLQIQSKYRTDLYPASPGFLNFNSLGGLFTVASGDPVTSTLTLANGLGVNAIFSDDYGTDPFVGNLSFVNNSMTSQAVVEDTKTVNAFNQCLLAVSLPSGGSLTPAITDGGTITDFFMLRMPGLLNQGSSLSVTNSYLIYMDDLGGSSVASNAWGLYLADSGLEHYIKTSLAIDTTSSKVTNSNVGLELGSTSKAIRLSNLTTSQRDAMTALSGMVIFNTDTSKLEYYDSSTWVAV